MPCIKMRCKQYCSDELAADHHATGTQFLQQYSWHSLLAVAVTINVNCDFPSNYNDDQNTSCMFPFLLIL